MVIIDKTAWQIDGGIPEDLEACYDVSVGRFSPFRVGLKTPISVNLKTPMHHVCC